MENLNTREKLLKELDQIKACHPELEGKLDELRKGQDMLVQTEKLASLSKLVSDMAHEINNPLMIISGRVELSLMDKIEDKGIEANFKTIAEQCDRLKDMIRKLLLFSKPSKGTMKAIDINESIESAVKSLEQENSFEGIQITKNFAPSLPKIEIDEKQMCEVFKNLIMNSAEAMPKGGSLAISTSGQDNSIRIDFKDTGDGIPQEDIKKIFDPFFTAKDKGAGLGLSMCYGIVKVHDGQLQYESTPGEGTTATLLLPVGKKGEA